MTPSETIVKAAMKGDVVQFRETVQQVLAAKATDALKIEKIQTGLTLLTPKE